MRIFFVELFALSYVTFSICWWK